MAFQGLMTYRGISQVIEGTFAFNCHGITPSVAQLTIVPQLAAFIPLDGDFIIYQTDLGLGSGIKFIGCRVDEASFRRDTNGLVWYLHLQDRRWAWKFGGAFGPLYGCYNRRNDDGTLDLWQLRTPRQLATLCLLAMGEPIAGPLAFDVSELPNDTNPEVNWEAANPAQELDTLCTQLGCRIVYTLNNSIAIFQTGKTAGGATPGPLPKVHVLESSGGLKPLRRPDSIRVVCGKTRYQADFPLAAAGRDLDGTIRKINDLSYKPAGGGKVAGGWQNEGLAPPTPFPNVPDNLGKDGKTVLFSARDLANKSVFRYYGIINQSADGTKPLVIPGFGGLARIEQVSPLESVQVVSAPANVWPGPVWAGDPLNPRAPTFNSIPAQIYGIYMVLRCEYLGYKIFSNTPRGTTYRGPFTINHDVGGTDFVEFEEYVRSRDDVLFKLNGKTEHLPAQLYLRTACNVRDPVTWAWKRFEYNFELDVAKTGAGPLVLNHPEIVLQFLPEYDIDTGKLQRVTSNLKDVIRECRFYVDQALRAFDVPTTEEVKYDGIARTPPDGATMQITWNVGGGRPCYTTVCRNQETAPYTDTYENRRLRAKAGLVAIENVKQQIVELRKGARRGANPA